MSQPTEYDVKTDFVAYQSNASWFPGSSLNVEFNNLATTTDQIRANLALIQRDDGALANASVSFNTLSPALQTAGLTPLSTWVSGKAYTQSQAVIQGTSLYQCQINHVSGAFSTDLAAGDWLLLANLALLSGVSTVNANQVAAGPTTGAAASPAFRSLVGQDLPTPTTSTLGGVQAINAVASRWINAVSAAGVHSTAQPAFTDISGTATIAQGGTGQVAAPAAIAALMPTPTRNGDLAFWNGSAWTAFAGNNVGTKTLQEDSGGNLSWVAGAFSLDPSFFPGFLGGLILSNDVGTPNTVLDIAAGACVDSTAGAQIKLAAFTKSTAGAWAAGSGSNGMGAGLTIANSTWYHVFAIINAAVADVYFDTSPTAVNAPISTTAFRRIGSFLTDGAAHIRTFNQNGNEFLWLTPFGDVGLNNTTSTAQLYTLTVPTGVKVNALIAVEYRNTAATGQLLLTPPDIGVQAQDTPAGLTSVDATTNIPSGGMFNIRTNTSAQIRAVSSRAANDQTSIATYGWIDTRGQ